MIRQTCKHGVVLLSRSVSSSHRTFLLNVHAPVGLTYTGLLNVHPC